MENPDRKDPLHGPLPPSGGDLRFQGRVVDGQDRKILQRWEWSYVDSKWDWYDVHLAVEIEEGN